MLVDSLISLLATVHSRSVDYSRGSIVRSSILTRLLLPAHDHSQVLSAV